MNLYPTLNKHIRRSREDIERKMSDFGFALGYIAGASLEDGFASVHPL